MTKTIKVWDLSTRVFHWGLAISFCLSWLSAELGGNWMIWHTYFGFITAGLLLFRCIWGVIGSETIRFSRFIKPPHQVITYLKGEDQSEYLTHNPAGGWSVMAMLFILLIQVITGLFSTDDIFIEGPLAYWVSYDAQLLATDIHEISFKLCMLLIVIHLIAVFWYQVVKKQNLINTMINGKRQTESGKQPELKSGWTLAFAVSTGVTVSLILYLMR